MFDCAMYVVDGRTLMQSKYATRSLFPILFHSCFLILQTLCFGSFRTTTTAPTDVYFCLYQNSGALTFCLKLVALSLMRSGNLMLNVVGVSVKTLLASLVEFWQVRCSHDGGTISGMDYRRARGCRMSVTRYGHWSDCV